MLPEITKKDFKLLERIFEKEMSGLLLLQSKSKEYHRLQDEGMVEYSEIILGDRFPVKIEGWILTHRGRMLFCQAC